MTRKIIIIFILLFFTSALSFAKSVSTGSWGPIITISGTIDGKFGSNTMMVYLPSSYNKMKKFPLVIALHGWDHSPALWKQNGNLGTYAEKYGIVLAIPNMGRTVYETSFYPETKGQWRTAPGTRWIGEVVLPYLRKHYAVYTDRAHTAIIGYSTGGRGAVLVAELYPNFAFVGSLSGTFDLMILNPSEGEYKIHEIIYGSREKFTDRWVKDNCVTTERLAQLKGTRLFIGHGSNDKSVNQNQLEALRDVLKGSSVDAEFLVEPNAIHDWSYWNSQWARMFKTMAALICR